MSRLPARVLLPSGERPAPTEAGAETGAAAERHWRSLAPRHALRRAQPHTQRSNCRHANKKRRGKHSAYLSVFWQGQKDLVSAPLRSARNLRATGTHSPPRHAVLEWMWESALGERGEGQCCPVSNASPREGGAGLVLWEIFRAKTGEKEREIPEKT